MLTHLFFVVAVNDNVLQSEKKTKFRSVFENSVLSGYFPRFYP